MTRNHQSSFLLPAKRSREAFLSAASRRWIRRLARGWLAVRYRLLDRRYRRLVLEQVHGVPLLVLPQVFNPVLLRSGAFLADALSELPLAAGERVLDLGCGAGVGAVFAARRGARVLAVDVNPLAVRCTRINALLNQVEDRVSVREGDLFAPLAGERFDLVLFNPPFYRGRPRDLLDYAWRGEQVPERFAAGLADHLTPGGRALLVLSTDGDAPGALAALAAHGFRAEPAAGRDLLNEVLTAYLVR
ncbi:MAG: methyltransferase [Chloroflexi bacterium]|nr:methyltransferase [Chloroflexota bacterium]